MGVSKITSEHLGITNALSLPLFVVITKTDLDNETEYQKNLTKIVKILGGPEFRKTPVVIPKSEAVDEALLEQYARQMPGKEICPVFSVSNVTNEGIPQLKKFVSLLESRVLSSGEFGSRHGPVEFLIDETYVLKNLGPIAGGTIIVGTVSVGDILQLGPNRQNGKFDLVKVNGIQYKRTEI